MATLRYNPQGQLGINPLFAAAASIGSNRGESNDQSFITSELNRRAQARQGSDQMNLEAIKMQRAGQMLLAQQQQPDANGYSAPRHPITNSMTLTPEAKAAKQLLGTTLLGGIKLTPEQQAMEQQLRDSNSVSPAQYQEFLTPIAKQQQQQQQLGEKAANAQAEKEQKFAYAKSLTNGFPVDTGDATQDQSNQAIREQIKAMVNDPESSLAQLRTAVTQVQSQRQQEAKQQSQEGTREKSFQQGMAESDRRSTREQAEKLRNELLQAGVNPDADANQPALQKPSHYGVFDWIETDAEEADSRSKDYLATQLAEYKRLSQASQIPSGGAPAPAAAPTGGGRGGGPPAASVRPGPGQAKVKIGNRIAIIDKASGQVIQELSQ